MKKISVIAVFLVFIISVIFVGFMGSDMHVPEEVIYVTEIEWQSTNFDNNKEIYDVYKYDETKQDGNDINATLKCYPKSIPQNGLLLNFKCVAIPNDAANTKLNYFMDQSTNGTYTFSEGGDKSLNVTFYKEGGTMLYVKSTDGLNVTYSIEIEVILP